MAQDGQNHLRSRSAASRRAVTSAAGEPEKALAGEIGQFTGVSDPYEPPVTPELHIKTDEEGPLDSACKVLEKLEFYGYVRSPADVEEYAEVLEG